jgi:hypothetical protein
MGSATGNLNGTGPQQIYVSITRQSQSQSGNYTTYRIIVKYLAKGYGSWSNSSQSWAASVGGSGAKNWSGTFVIASPGTSDITVLDTTFNKTHDANGNLAAFSVSGSINTDHSSIGDGSASFTEPAPPRIPKVPGKPAAPVLIAVATTTIDYSFANPSDNGGSTITQWNHQSATDAAFTQNVQNWNDATTPAQAASLIPGTQTWIRIRAVNSIGSSAWSDPLVQTTLPAVPPGLTVVASPSGTQATLTFAPPGGVTGVTKYTWERRVFGTTTPVTTGDSTVISTVVSGLVPGTKYEWRASAWIGTYQSPVSSWQAVTQPKPNTSPGDYFDGSTSDSADLDFAWTGTANASTSTATAQVPIGWEVQFPATGSGTIFRVTAGEFGPFAARVQILVDAAEGVRMGQRNATGYQTSVTETGDYVGSIYVFLSRPNNVAAEITWLTSAGTVISRSPGTPVNVPGGTWFRLVTAGTAPAGAAFAVVRMLDVAGTGWSNWKGGDTVDLDGAMVTLNEQFDYFDGDTAPDGEFIYDWTGASNASTSTRTPVSQAAPGSLMSPNLPSSLSLVDPDCPPVPAPPRPPTIPNDCVTDSGVWRRYYADIPSVYVSDWLAVVPTLGITTGSSAARQVRIRFYPNPAGLAASDIDINSWCAEQIISYMPAKTVMTIDGVTQRVWAEVNGALPLAADHLLYGTGGKPASWPILSCGMGYVISLEVPTDAPAGNIEVAAALTTRT